MAGGMFAGHDESGGDIVEEDGIFYKDFYGMSSAVAMEKHSGGVAEYRSSEGKHVRVAYRGPIAATCVDILGGIRSTCTCAQRPPPPPPLCVDRFRHFSLIRGESRVSVRQI